MEQNNKDELEKDVNSLDDSRLDSNDSNEEKKPEEKKKKMTLEKGISMAKFYSLSTQGILNMAVMAGIGYLIGYFTLPNTPWPPVFAVIGLLCGLVSFISYILFLTKGDKKHEPKDKS